MDDHAYRERPAPRATAVVTHMALPLFQRLAMTFALLAWASAICFVIMPRLARTTLDCSHADDRCVVTRRVLGMEWTYTTFAPSSVTLLRLRQVHTKAGARYHLEVDTRGGTVGLSTAWDRDDRRREEQRDLQRFIDDGGAPPLHMLYDPGDDGVVLVLPFLCVALPMIPFAWRATRLTFDWSAERLVIRDTPPLPWRRRRVFALTSLVGARVEEHQQRKRTLYVVKLMMADGSEVALDPAGSPGEEHALKTVRLIGERLRGA